MSSVNSKKFKLNFNDLIKGFLIASLTAVLTGCGQLIEQWVLSDSLKISSISLIIMLKTAIVGGLAYLIKQFFSN